LHGIVAPLRARGARIEIADTPDPRASGEVRVPIAIGPLSEGETLGELEYEGPTPNADAKGAVLLSGLYAHGTTWFKEPALSPDHTERMLHALGVPLRTLGTMVELDPSGWDGVMKGFALDVPGDPSASAVLAVAAQMFPGSRVTVRNVGTNPTRTGFFELMRQMGAGLEVNPLGDRGGEPVGEVTAWPGDTRGILVGGELVPRAEDDISILCVLAARARGTTTLRDAEGLRQAKPDRLAAMALVLRAFGVTCEELPDGLVIEGREGPLDAAVVDSQGDHRIAMAATVLALAGGAPSRIDDCDGIAARFPRFVGTLRALGARLDVET
jgi:3-phosphoshikimate 1-carboxyvinyltransferase